MFDEPSLGLSPILVQEMFRVIEELHSQGLTIFLVEQNVHQTLKIADYCYVMENGRIMLHGSSDELRNNEDIREFYLGLGASTGARSYRDVKHYKRRKRWLA